MVLNGKWTKEPQFEREAVWSRHRIGNKGPRGIMKIGRKRCKPGKIGEGEEVSFIRSWGGAYFCSLDVSFSRVSLALVQPKPPTLTYINGFKTMWNSGVNTTILFSQTLREITKSREMENSNHSSWFCYNYSLFCVKIHLKKKKLVLI